MNSENCKSKHPIIFSNKNPFFLNSKMGKAMNGGKMLLSKPHARQGERWMFLAPFPVQPGYWPTLRTGHSFRQPPRNFIRFSKFLIKFSFSSSFLPFFAFHSFHCRSAADFNKNRHFVGIRGGLLAGLLQMMTIYKQMMNKISQSPVSCIFPDFLILPFLNIGGIYKFHG